MKTWTVMLLNGQMITHKSDEWDPIYELSVNGCLILQDKVDGKDVPFMAIPATSIAFVSDKVETRTIQRPGIIPPGGFQA